MEKQQIASIARHFESLPDIGKNKKAWLKTFLELPKSTPALGTLGRIFAQIKPADFNPLPGSGAAAEHHRTNQGQGSLCAYWIYPFHVARQSKSSQAVSALCSIRIQTCVQRSLMPPRQYSVAMYTPMAIHKR